MSEKRTSAESPIEVEMKENGHEKQIIDPLIEPVVALNIDKPVPSLPTKVQRFSGILYALAGAFLFTIPVFITKELNVDLLDALIPRFLVQSIMLIIYMKFIKHYSLYKQSQKKELVILLIHVLAGATGFFSFFVAYRYLPLPDVTTVRYTQVIWTAIITAFLYHEKPSIPMIISVLLTMIGVTLVAQPQFLFEKSSNITKNETGIDYRQHSIGLFIALYASIGMSIMLITNKYLFSTYKTKQSSLMFHFAFVSLLMVLTHTFYKYYFVIHNIQSLKTDFLNWRYLCASSICLFQILSSVLTQKAVKREHPSIFTIVQSSDILFAIVLQNIFSSTKSNILSLFGSGLVLTSIVMISVVKLMSGKKKKVQT